MNLSILKRPRKGIEVKLFEQLKNSLKKEPRSLLNSLVDDMIVEFNEENGRDIKFHTNEYNLVILDEKMDEIILFRINE